MTNINLTTSKKKKNDEFYTQYTDIKNEIESYDTSLFRDKVLLLPCDSTDSNFVRYFSDNFNIFKLKKLIYITYNPSGKGIISIYDGHNTMNTDMNSDGDFRSDEMKHIKDLSDIVITNPPFSLFREFLSWLTDGNKSFIIVGNMNAITYKEVFPLIKNNKIWLGVTANGSDMVFRVPDGTVISPKDAQKAARMGYKGNNYTRLGNSCWFTNINHNKRQDMLMTDTMADNEARGVIYDRYDNYDALEVPRVALIPSDYDGQIGVPISFLPKYCPKQFEIIRFRKGTDGKDLSVKGHCPYFRIIIRRKIANEAI